MKNKTDFKTKLFFIISGTVLFVLCLLSLMLGAVHIPPAAFFPALFNKDGSVYSVILHSLRLPETVAAILAGAGLGISGVLLQNVTDNKMASPGLIGVSQGAGFGVIVLLYFFPRLYELTPLFAFGGAFLSTLFIMALSGKIGLTRTSVVLVGIAFSSVLSAGISLIALLDADVLVSYNAFSAGSLSSIPMKRLFAPSIMILVCFVFSMIMSKKSDMLLMGDYSLISLGENPKKIRFVLMLLASISSASVVSFAGLLGFVGLMSPHIARLFVRENSRILLPASALTGSCLVLLSLIVSRSIFAEGNVPAGIILSAVGAPFFLCVLLVKGGKGNA